MQKSEVISKFYTEIIIQASRDTSEMINPV